MRRFAAYVLASLTIFMGIGVAFKPVATKINADLSYRNGNTIYFRLEKRDGGKSFEDYNGKAAQYYADIMTDRLEAYGVSDYKINIQGDRNISVTLTTENASECTNIGKLLATNPEIEVSNLADETKQAVSVSLADEEGKTSYWHSNKSYITFDGTTTIVVMPIPDQLRTKAKEMIEQAKKYEEEKKSSNDDEPKTVKNSIVLWMNREGAEYKPEDKIIQRKIIYDKMNSTNFYYGSGENAFQIRFTPSSSKVTDISASYKEALYMMNLLNAEKVDFDCVVTKTIVTEAAVENLLVYGDTVHIAMSSTFISLMIAFILICLLLALFYRLGAVAIVSTASLNTFLTFTLFVFFKPLFNIAALIGVISVFAASIFLGVLYNHYLHEEVYKGRSLKKANFEASKKTTLITVDISVVAMLLGIGLYFVGGRTVSSLGVMFIVSAIFNLFINTFVLKGLMWLITNNTKTQKQYKLLAIDGSKVPDLAREEKPTYVGPYEKKDFTKKKKLSAIIFGALTVASCVGMIVFASVKKDIFNSTQYYETRTSLHLVYQTEASGNEPTTVEYIKTKCLPSITHNGTPIKFNSDINAYSYDYYVRDLSEAVITKKNYVYDITINESNIEANEFSVTDGISNTTLALCLNDVFDKIGNLVDTIPESLATSKVTNLPSNAGLTFGATAIAIVTTGLYFWIRRYRLSRVVPTMCVALSSNVISLGLITLTRIPATPVMAIGIGLTTLYTFLAAQFLMHKEKDILRDERLKNIETRKAALDKSLHTAALPLINFAIIVLFIVLCFLAISNKTFSAVFFSTTLSIAASTIMLLTLFTPFSNLLDKKLSMVKLPEVKIKKKKKKIVEKSNEPEEAIFIGIND